MVERRLAKAEVAGSSPVSRSTYEMEGTTYPRFINRRHSQAVRQRSAKPSSPVRFRVAPPKRSTCKAGASFLNTWGMEHARAKYIRPAPRGRLRQTLVGCKSAAPLCGAPVLYGSYPLRTRQKSASAPCGLSIFVFILHEKRRVAFWKGIGNREP